MSDLLRQPIRRPRLRGRRIRRRRRGAIHERYRLDQAITKADAYLPTWEAFPGAGLPPYTADPNTSTVIIPASNGNSRKPAATGEIHFPRRAPLQSHPATSPGRPSSQPRYHDGRRQRCQRPSRVLSTYRDLRNALNRIKLAIPVGNTPSRRHGGWCTYAAKRQEFQDT